MERVTKILENADYRSYLALTAADEQQRIYCRHDMQHALAVARIAYILHLEAGGRAEQQAQIYATALLHDCGRHFQYADGSVCHAAKSAELAQPILQTVGFEEAEISEMVSAIAAHRRGNGTGQLAELLFRADVLSRQCRECTAAATCNWTAKNQKLTY